MSSTKVRVPCPECGCPMPVRPDKKSKLCASCWRKRRCAACGQILGLGEHRCNAVSTRGDRYCKTCGRLLRIANRFERWNDYCTRCGGRRRRKIDRYQRTCIKAKFGGRCCRCGYDRCEDALQFHHTQGRNHEERSGSARLGELKRHPERFELVCANCHFEIHAAMRQKAKSG